MSESYVYLMASESGTLYVGSTVHLESRVLQHKEKLYPNSFTAIYHCTKLVYYEICEDLDTARIREKQIKQWRREKKIRLIRQYNPAWVDLSMRWQECSS